MADEIQYGFRLVCTNGAAVERFPEVSTTFDQTTQGADGGIISVGSGAEEDLTITDVTTPGILYLRNLNATNFVSWGPKSGGVMILCGKLLPQGEPAVFRLGASVTIRMIADTAACNVQWRVLSA